MNCGFCQNEIETWQESGQCPECGAYYHADCWQANQEQCSALGCAGYGELDFIETTNYPYQSKAVRFPEDSFEEDEMAEGELIVCIHCNGSSICTKGLYNPVGNNYSCPSCVAKLGQSPDTKIIGVICSVCGGKGHVWIGPENTKKNGY